MHCAEMCIENLTIICMPLFDSITQAYSLVQRLPKGLKFPR